MAKLLWQRLQGSRSEEHFQSRFLLHQETLTNDCFDCGPSLGPIQTRLKKVIQACSDRRKEDEDIGQGAWGEAFWLPPEYGDYVRRRIRRARLDLIEQAANYPSATRFGLNYLLVDVVKGIEVPSTAVDRIYRGYYREEFNSRRVLQVVEIEADGELYPLINGREPTAAPGYNFSWGYGGGGPYALAISILADATNGDIELAWELGEQFMKDRLIDLPKDEDIAIPLGQVTDWLRHHGKTEKEMEQRHRKVQRSLKKFAPEIKKLKDTLANIRRSGPLRSQKFQIVAPDFESALYVDLVEMLSKNGFVLYCNGCGMPISCDESPRSNRQRGRHSSGRPVYHPDCAEEKALERKRKDFHKRSQNPEFREARKLEARSRRKQ
jgi:hypothetical protein